MAALRRAPRSQKRDEPAYSETAVLTRQKAGLEQLIKEAGFKGVHIVQDGIAMRFTSV